MIKDKLYLNFQVIAISSEECHNLCLTSMGCRWFSYDALTSTCWTLKNCTTLDKSCETCVSSTACCRAKTSKGSFKIMLDILGGCWFMNVSPKNTREWITEVSHDIFSTLLKNSFPFRNNLVRKITFF